MSTPSAAPVPTRSKAALWTGRVLSGLVSLMLLMGAAANFLKLPFAVEGSKEMGYTEAVMLPLGIAVTTAVVLYLIPQTAALGAIILTGYLGGAVDAHVHHGDPLGQMLFPVVFAAIAWTGLILRDPLLRARIFRLG